MNEAVLEHLGTFLRDRNVGYYPLGFGLIIAKGIQYDALVEAQKKADDKFEQLTEREKSNLINQSIMSVMNQGYPTILFENKEGPTKMSFSYGEKQISVDLSDPNSLQLLESLVLHSLENDDLSAFPVPF